MQKKRIRDLSNAATGKWGVVRHSYSGSSMHFSVIHDTKAQAIDAAQATFAASVEKNTAQMPPRFYVVHLESVVGFVDGHLKDGTE